MGGSALSGKVAEVFEDAPHLRVDRLGREAAARLHVDKEHDGFLFKGPFEYLEQQKVRAAPFSHLQVAARLILCAMQKRQGGVSLHIISGYRGHRSEDCETTRSLFGLA